MRTSRFVLLLGLAVGSVSLLGQERPVPTYRVAHTNEPVRVDGRLDDLAWRIAHEVGPFVDNRDGSPSSYETQAKILWDNEFLYFAFRCVDDNIWATMRQRDQHLWTEEVVEVFIQADRRHPSYVELEVNPLGTLIDIFLIDIRKPLKYESWNSDRIRWAVTVNGTVDGQAGDREWSCEIALPLEDIVTAPNIPPQAGDTWRLNLYRVEKLPHRAGLAWSPTLKPDFHIPERFGEVVFVK